MQVDGKSAVERRIAGAFKAASDATGTSFDYLLQTSARESDHRPELGSDSSTAKGLFQFLDQTWLELVRREGPTVGLERLADKIQPDGNGNWTVADPADRAKILSLRSDPLVSSVMAARFTQDNARRLTDSLGRTPTEGELYAAHVLGPAGATKLLKLADREPATPASIVFPRAAAANPGLFYDRTGRAKSVAELTTRLTTPRDMAADPTARRIVEAHAALAASGKRTDPASLALVMRAQAAALVGAEVPGVGTTTPTAADRNLTRTAFAATAAMPGASDAAQAGRLDGWRAKQMDDAFSTLMRDDGSDAPATTAPLPGVAGPKAAMLAPARARAAGAGAGGIARVDPTAPLALAAAPATTEAATRPAVRSSRLTRAATGAPDMPLPMVDAATGATRPSRLLFSDRAPSETTGDGTVRVRTTTVVPPTATTAAAASPTPAPPPTAAAPATAPATTRTATTPVPATVPAPAAAAGTAAEGAATRRARSPADYRPLDLLALARRGRVS